MTRVFLGLVAWLFLASVPASHAQDDTTGGGEGGVHYAPPVEPEAHAAVVAPPVRQLQRAARRPRGQLHARTIEQARFEPIAPGTFQMGSPGEPHPEAGRRSNEVQHQVTLTVGFEMQATEVTQAQWVDIMGINPSLFQNKVNCPRTYRAARGATPALCPDNPVENVSYNEIQTFISRVNQPPRQCTYRLPTEAEWEYAARAGPTTAHSFGAAPIDNYAVTSENANTSAARNRMSTAAVARGRHDNPWHLYDMHGNVAEWTADVYGEYPTGPVTNPPGPVATSDSNRVVRGGGWPDSAGLVRSAQRSGAPPGDRYGDVGFRFVRACP